MVYLCRSKDCGGSFSTVFNWNKHEKLKGHWLRKKNNVNEFNKELSLFICPTAGCSTTSKDKNNIVKYLKSCFAINRQHNSVADNKICPVCKKEFIEKSNRDKHLKQFHAEKNASDDIVTEDVRPTMVPISSKNLTEEETPNIETSSDLSVQEIYNDEAVSSDNVEDLEMIEQNHNESNTYELITKRSRLQNVISRITKNIDHSFTLNQCVIEKLKHDIKITNLQLSIT